MRRLLAFVLVAVFSLQATASAASPGQVQTPNMQPLALRDRELASLRVDHGSS